MLISLVTIPRLSPLCVPFVTMSRGIVYPLPTLLSKARPRSKELLDSPGLVERYPLQIRLSSRATFGEGVLLRAKNLSTRKVTMFDATHKSVVDVIFDEIEELIMLELDIEQPTYEVKLLNLEVDDYKATELTCPVCAKVIQKAFARHVR